MIHMASWVHMDSFYSSSIFLYREKKGTSPIKTGTWQLTISNHVNTRRRRGDHDLSARSDGCQQELPVAERQTPKRTWIYNDIMDYGIMLSFDDIVFFQ